MHVGGTFAHVVRSQVVLAEVVAKVDGARCPVDDELSLLVAVADPVAAHVHGFGLVLFASAMDDAVGSSIVGLAGCGWLFPPKFFEGGAGRDGPLRVGIEAAHFGIGGSIGDMFEHTGGDVDGAIVDGRQSFVGVG